MLFNSLVFAVFLPLVFAAYWSLNRNLRAQNLLLITAGFVFYGWWDWRFLLLLLATSLTDYFVALAMGRTTSANRRRWLMGLSLVGNLGTLGTFKYFDFFSMELTQALASVNMEVTPVLLGVLLPVGISFYTFQALSYTIDVYRGRIAPVRDISVFMAFISFFPQLCAGPIERASHMLPQFSKPRRFDLAQASDGMRQMLWGFFKKSVIADGCSPIVNGIFEHPGWHGADTLLLGAVLFAFQIYGDFSGYTDIALGCARLFGFDLMRNFAYPYFSRDIAEFWRRWHISLSSWFRDYVYVPLGGSRGSKSLKVRNVMIIFLLSGFWHGANWTFIGWGVVHGAYYVPEILRDGKARRDVPVLRDLPAIISTFLLVVLAWVFFRSSSIHTAGAYLFYMVRNALVSPGALLVWCLRAEMGWILFVVVLEWIARRGQHALEVLPRPTPLRWAIYFALTVVILLHIDMQTSHEFIYFQF